MTRKQLAARAKGGQARAAKYDHEQLSAWARLGDHPGRPHKISLGEARARLALSNKNKGGWF